MALNGKASKEQGVARIAERMSQAVKRDSISEIARKTGVSVASASRYLAGQREPPATFLAALAEAYDANPAWLLLGRGRPDMDPDRPPTVGGGRREARASQPELQPMMVDEVGKRFDIRVIWEPGKQVISAEQYEALPDAEKAIWVPIVGIAQCGPAVERSAEHPVGWADEFGKLDRPPRDPHALLVELAGNSMAPHWRAGDLVLANPSRLPDANLPAVIVFDDGAATFKTWRQDPQTLELRLIPYNAEFDEERRPMHEVRRIMPVDEHIPAIRKRDVSSEEE